MEQRVSAITLGVADLVRARTFYGRLGWQTTGDDQDIAFFQAGGMAVALWGRARLADDSAVADTGAGTFDGIVLAHNVRSPREVDDVVHAALEAGARVTRPPGATFWGGYSAVFADPDGHLWEIAYNPHWSLRDDGSLDISGE